MTVNWKRWIGITLLGLLLTACASRQSGAQYEAAGGTVAFRVGATTVTVEDVRRRMEQDFGPPIQNLLAQGQTIEEIAQLAEQQNIRNALFENMIQEELLVQAARRQGIGVDPKAVDEVIGAEQQQLNLQRDGSAAFEKLTGQRVSMAREQLVVAMIARHTTADMFKARHILVADEATADKVLAELNNGRTFADLAQEYSIDPGSKDQGGELGWTPKGDFDPEFERVGFSAELQKPVKVNTQFGWHVIEVEARQGQRPFENLEQLRRSQNGQQFYTETFLPWYEKLRADAEASGELEISAGFDPNSIPLPFPAQP